MNGIRPVVFLMVFVLAVIPATARSVQADAFTDTATNPSFQRDIHAVSAGSTRVDSAQAGDGPDIAISYDYLFVGSNIWNNEHNQILGGIQYGSRAFDRQLALPDGFDMPARLDSTSAAFIYKHITSGDWSISQSVRYTWSRTDSPSVDVKDRIDLIGLAAISYEPGVAWVFGYYYDQTTDTKNHLYPVVEYINNRYDRWSFTVGYPVVSAAFSPHPDVLLAIASIAYKVTDQNIVRLSYADDNWAYRLKGPDVKSVAYTAQRVGLGWTYVYYVDHRTSVVLNGTLGWEFGREFGADTKLSLDDAAFMGINATLSF